MKTLITICLVLVCVCVLWPVAAQANQLDEDIYVHVWQVENPGYEVPSLWVCKWLELSTEDYVTSWIVHADEDIYDLHFGTWENMGYLLPGEQPFEFSYHTCTFADLGGPPGGPQKTFWQTLDLWDGEEPPMPECTYWQISISHLPMLHDEVQNLWVHPTPEPTTMALLGLGSLALLRKRRA